MGGGSVGLEADSLVYYLFPYFVEDSDPVFGKMMVEDSPWRESECRWRMWTVCQNRGYYPPWDSGYYMYTDMYGLSEVDYFLKSGYRFLIFHIWEVGI